MPLSHNELVEVELERKEAHGGHRCIRNVPVVIYNEYRDMERRETKGLRRPPRSKPEG